MCNDSSTFQHMAKHCSWVFADGEEQAYQTGFGLIWFEILLNNTAALDILGVSWYAEMQIKLSSPKRYTQTSFLQYVWCSSYEAYKLQSFLEGYIILQKKFFWKILKYMRKKETKYLCWFCKKKSTLKKTFKIF